MQGEKFLTLDNSKKKNIEKKENKKEWRKFRNWN